MFEKIVQSFHVGDCLVLIEEFYNEGLLEAADEWAKGIHSN